jgi:hypothetical protein
MFKVVEMLIFIVVGEIQWGKSEVMIKPLQFQILLLTSH